MERIGIEERLGPRIGVWGTFDLASYGDLLFPRICQREILHRLPLATVRPFSPLGDLHPVAMDGGLPAAPLGPWEASRRSELAAGLDFVIVGGGDLLHVRDDAYGILYRWTPEETSRLQPSRFFVDGLGPALETRCPIAWNAPGAPFGFTPEEAQRVREALATKAYLAVRDEITRERLLETGTDREVHVVPDSALLLADLFSADVLALRLRFLRTMGWYPADRPPLVVQGSAAITKDAAGIAEAVRASLEELGNPPVLLIEINPCHGDGQFLDALAPRLPGPVYRMPAGVALEDVAAAIASSRAFAGLSLHGAVTALAFGVPFVLANLAEHSRLDGFARLAHQEDVLIHDAAELPAALRRALAPERPALLRSILAQLRPRISAHFDRLAELAERSWAARAEEEPSRGPAALARELVAAREQQAALQRRWDALRHRLAEERLRFAEIVDGFEAAGGGQAQVLERVSELRGWVEILEARCARADHERHQAEACRAAAEERLAAYECLMRTRLMRSAARLQRVLARLRQRS